MREDFRDALRLVIPTMLVAALITSCGTKDPDSSKPLDSLSDSPTSTDTLGAEQQEVVDAWQAYNDVIDAVARGGKLELTEFKAVAKEPLATRIAKNVDATASAGILLKGGSATYAPEKVTVDGTAATYKLCQDASKARYVNTGVTPAATVPVKSPVRELEVTMAQVGQKWKVTGTKDLGPCSKENQ